MEIKDGKDYIPQVRELIVLKIIEYDKSKFVAVPFAFRCASCSCRAVALSSVRNMSRQLSKLMPAQLLHPAPLVDTRKFQFV